MPVVLAGLPAAAAGIMALVLIFGALLLVDAIFKAIDISAIPSLIGDFLRAMAAGIAAAVNWIGSFFVSVARGAMSLFTVPALGYITFADAVITGIARISSWTRWLVTSEVPSLWRSLSATASSVLNAAIAYATARYQQVLGIINSVSATLSRAITTGVSTAVNLAQSLYRLTIAQLTATAAQLNTLMRGLFNVAMSTLALDVAALTRAILQTTANLSAYSLALAQWAMNNAIGISIDWAKKYSDQLIDLYNRAIGATGAIAMAPAWPTALEAIDAISLALPDSIAAVLARVGAIPRSIPKDITAEVGIATAIGTIAIDWVKNCGLSLCKNTKGFGDELSQLGDDILIGELIALAIEANRDPNGTAGDAVTELAGIPNELGHDLTSILTAMI